MKLDEGIRHPVLVSMDFSVALAPDAKLAFARMLELFVGALI